MKARAGVLVAGLILVGCGAGARRQDSAAQAPAARPNSHPPVVRLQLELPLVGLSSAPTVSYGTTAAHPLVRGAVVPSTATLYMLSPDGTRTAVNPDKAGTFAVHPKLTPGQNTFQFTAARLGARSAQASLQITWRGPAADAMSRAIAADPAKFLPPASAGLNRKLPALPSIPQLAQGAVAVSFSLNPIKAPPPPAVGGPGTWLAGFELTEYYPALEAWFIGAPVPAPGLSRAHRIDWLYSAQGLSMEGDGVGLDGRQYHVAALGSGGWLTASGSANSQFGGGANAPYWRTGGFWRTAGGGLTFPLLSGGWSNGPGVRYVPPPGITFAPGPSRASLAYLRSIAVDPRVIPMGSHVFIPAYQSINGGWFEADDTGGAIIGRHIDVFRPPPANPNDQGNFATGQSVYVVPPGVPLP
jgi:3D (Asp-Asp-Asp) domain-containing protein